MQRLFVAIDLPAEVKSSLAALPPELPAARWVGAGEIHLTLRFLGDTGSERCAAIKDALAGVAFGAFSITLRGVGHFPPGRHPKVLWVGMDRCHGLLALHRQLELALAPTGVPADEHSFTPHVTLARLRESAPSLVESFESAHRELSFPGFPVREFSLYSSVLTSHGPIHTREATFPAGDAPLP